ncbi:MAG: hypothetical protein GY795_40355 [Desulfobacterales bacterium]|nr:hypothetical protein [Desulfobacterales bacterium]
MKFWHSLLYSMPKFHFGTPSDCQSENEECRKTLWFSVTSVVKNSKRLHSNYFYIGKGY